MIDETQIAARKRGRPPGSRNKPKSQTPFIDPATIEITDEDNEWRFLDASVKTKIFDIFSTPTQEGMIYPNIFTHLSAKDGIAKARGYFRNTRDHSAVELACRYI